MRQIYTLILWAVVACAMTAQNVLTATQSTFYRGADISWYTEMEAGGQKFYNATGQETECNQLMAECGMNAIRLRVWVEPTLGGWCGTEDVVRKAVAARAAGHEVMVDLHYSDFFADPGRQAIPAAWQGKSLDEMAQLVAQHTTDVLQALKDAGVEPRWVQLGNETRNGMLYSRYDATTHQWTEAQGVTGSTSSQYGGGWQNYVRLSNAGYEAAHKVFPHIACLVHLDTRSSDTDLSWWFRPFIQAGGKLDMVALSHYPMPWASSEATARTNALKRNANLMTIIANTYATVKFPFVIAETGVYVDFVQSGKEVMADLLNKCHQQGHCEGVFYWEPEQYNWWKPAIYTQLGWQNYNMAAFLSSGRPSAILDAFVEDARTSHIGQHEMVRQGRGERFDLQGRPAIRGRRGIQIEAGRKIVYQ